MSWLDNLWSQIDNGANAAKNVAQSVFDWQTATSAQQNGAAGQPDLNQPVATRPAATDAAGQVTQSLGAGSMTHVLILGGAALAGLMLLQKAA